MKKPKEMILTAGPSVGPKEIKYVLDAAKNGWNRHWADYIHKFEKAFAKYIGTKYALATSGGTGALQLGLWVMGIKEGDEVILPEITYFACSDVIRHLGATPVFTDILPDTWCIDPGKMKKSITRKTKAIMPVHIYGNPAEMDEIMDIAREYNLKVLEDACPAIGSIYKDKHPGAIGDIGAFSFQGAKIMVTGTGGMFVTDNAQYFEKARYINDHGEDKSRKFWQTAVGFEFEMSNLQAAFGLAQLERIDSFVKKKRQIFSWYFEKLKDIDGLSFNSERPGTLSNRWMTSIILDRDFGITRDELIGRLRRENIDSRPFFYPTSMFPMYKEKNTPVAHHVGLNGINLPSGLNLTKEEAEYVAGKVRKILGK